MEKEKIYIWLDDIRPAPEGFSLARSVNEAKSLIEGAELNFEIGLIDCDHDLGDYSYDGGDGIKLLDWLLERGTLYPVAVHTMNPVGRENMERMIVRYWGNRSCGMGGTVVDTNGGLVKVELDLGLSSWYRVSANMTVLHCMKNGDRVTIMPFDSSYTKGIISHIYPTK